MADSEVSHNFIAPQVAPALGLKVEQNRCLGARLGDGHRVTTRGKCQNLEVLLGNFPTVVGAYVLGLGDLDLILGASWMQRFGKVTFDWDEMKLSFPWQGKIKEIQG